MARGRSVSPQLRALGPGVRILAAFIDALILGVALEDAWEHPLVKTQILMETGDHEGWHEDQALRTMRRWGARDQHGIYAAAGLNKAETEVAFLYFDRQLEPTEIATLLRRPATTVRVQLYRANERLRRLSVAA